MKIRDLIACSIGVLVSTQAGAETVGECMAKVLPLLQDTVTIQDNSSYQNDLYNWFCSDEEFQAYFSREGEQNLSILLDDVSLGFDENEDVESQQEYRRKYCSAGRNSMRNREAYALTRSILNRDAKKILDNCVAGINRTNISPLSVSLNSTTKVTAKATIKATPIGFGEIAPILTAIDSNMSCNSLPSGGIALTPRGYSFHCKHQLESCDVGYLVTTTNTGLSESASFYVPASGKLGTAIVSYKTKLKEWAHKETKKEYLDTSRAGIDCDDDGDYKGGHYKSHLKITVPNNHRIGEIIGDRAECVRDGAANHTCVSYIKNLSQQAASIFVQHHSCTGITPLFEATYTIEHQIDRVNQDRTESQDLVAGGIVDFLLPGDAYDVVVIINPVKGGKQIISGLDRIGSDGEVSSYRAERSGASIRLSTSTDCEI